MQDYSEDKKSMKGGEAHIKCFRIMEVIAKTAYKYPNSRV